MVVVAVVVVAVVVSRWESRNDERVEDVVSSVVAGFFLLESPWRRTSSAFSMSSRLTPCESGEKGSRVRLVCPEHSLKPLAQHS